jgi:hypothetical protein
MTPAFNLFLSGIKPFTALNKSYSGGKLKGASIELQYWLNIELKELTPFELQQERITRIGIYVADTHVKIVFAVFVSGECIESPDTLVMPFESASLQAVADYILRAGDSSAMWLSETT